MAGLLAIGMRPPYHGAFARIKGRTRPGTLESGWALTEALRRLGGLVDAADVVSPTARVRDRAGRLLGSHALRAADAVQLAAALVWCDEAPRGEPFVCLDERLADAARREGFSLLPA